MIHPSYVDLMKVVNKDVEEGETPVINSRYSIVMATAKRARQIIKGDEPLVKVSRGEKPLSIAVAELNEGEIRILSEDEVEEDFLVSEETADTAGESGDVVSDAASESDEIVQETSEEGDSGVSDEITLEEYPSEESVIGDDTEEDAGFDAGEEETGEEM